MDDKERAKELKKKIAEIEELIKNSSQKAEVFDLDIDKQVLLDELQELEEKLPEEKYLCDDDCDTSKINENKDKSKFVPENEMEKYDWSKSIFRGAGKKWVYYRVPLRETGEYEDIKLVYDRSKDWDFEHEKE